MTSNRLQLPESARSGEWRAKRSDADALVFAVQSLAELEAAAGTGQPLQGDVRDWLAPLLGHDLTTVRIHHDQDAAELAEAAGAEAFALGNHIWFGRGRYQPTTEEGRELLAHEIAHVLAATDAKPSLGDRSSTDHSLESVLVADQIEEQAADNFASGATQDGATHLAAAKTALQARARTGRALARRAVVEGSEIAANVDPGRALAGLVDRLLQRNPDDRGGRIKAVFARLEDRTKAAVLESLDQKPGAKRQQLDDVLALDAPEDGGIDATELALDKDAATDVDGDAETEAAAEPAVEADAVAEDADEVPAQATTDEPTVESLSFDPDAELPAEPGPDVPDIAATEDDEAAPPREASEAADESGDAATQANPPTGAGAAAVGGSAGGAAAPDSGVDIEEELAEAIEPALEAQVPSDDEAAAVVELQRHAEGPELAEDADQADDPADNLAEEPADIARSASEPTQPAADARTPDFDNPAPEADTPSFGGAGGAEADAAEAAEAVEVEQPEAVDPLAELGSADADVDTAPGPGETAAGPGAGADIDAAAAEAGVGGEEAKTGDACAAAPAPAPMQDPAGGGACGGGAGGSGEAEAADDAAQSEGATDASPAGAVGSVASLKASARPAALEAAGASATTEVSGMQDELAAGPPSIERPSGVPGGRDASIAPAALPAPTPSADRDAPELDDAQGGTVPEEKTLPAPGADVTSRVTSPRLGGDTKITKDDVKKVRRAVAELPTTDAALSVSAGPAPTLVLDGEADPNRVTNQATGVVETTTALQEEANGHIVEDFGDRDIYPVVPKETLTAQIDVTAISIAPSGGAGTGKVPPVVIDRLAEDESGPADRTAIGAESKAMSKGRTKHDEDAETSRTEAKDDLDKAVQENAKKQSDTRQSVASESDAGRQSWVDETAKTSKDTRDATKKASGEADKTIGDAKTKAKTESDQAVTDGNATIKTERTVAEKDARTKKAEAKRKSEGGGFFSWLGSKVTSFFNGIKNAIKKAFDAARAAVDKAVKKAQKLAVAAIELGRKAAVAAIEAGGKALVAAGDIALAGFPGAREKWRSTIESGVKKGKEAVNKLADDLKAGVKKILDLLGKALKAYLNALETIYTAAIEAVEAVVQGAIKFAKSVAEAFGEWLEIAADIARGPLSWLSKLGAGARDGARNCTWPALKSAVKTWFREKVEAVVGVGRAVFDVLLKGCISFAQVAKMAWSAIKASLPGILVQLLVEKLVAMLIPAGGALSLIIDGLRAAWGAASRILAAFQAFLAFLKAVRGGGAAAKFGSLVGSAAVAVLDFLSNFVLERIMAAGKKVGAALKKTAGKIMAQLKRAAAAAKKAAGKAMGAAKRAGKSAVGAVKKAGGRAVGAVKATAKKAGSAIAKTKVGKAVVSGTKAMGRGARKVVDKGKKALAKRKQKAAAKKGKPDKKKETPQEKLNRIAAIIRPKIEGWFDRGIGKGRLRIQLAALRVRHRLRSLKAVRSGGGLQVSARVNPTVTVGDALFPTDARLNQIVREVSEEILQEAWLQGFDRTADSGAGFLGRARDAQFPFRDPSDIPASERKRKVKGTSQTHLVGADQIPVNETRGAGDKFYSRTNWEVTAMGKYDKDSGNMPAVHRVLSGFGDGDDRIGAQRLKEFVQTGVVPEALAGQKKKLAAAAHLLFTRETARRTSNAAHAAFMTDLVESGDATFQSMLADPDRDPERAQAAQRADQAKAKASGGDQKASAATRRVTSGGALPVSMEGAMSGARGASPEQQAIDGKSQSGTSNKQDVEELLRREAALTKRWLRARGWSMNATAAADAELKELAENHLRNIIRLKVRSFYGLQGPGASS